MVLSARFSVVEEGVGVVGARKCARSLPLVNKAGVTGAMTPKAYLSAPSLPAEGDVALLYSSRVKAVTFVNRYFHPDHSATSQLLSDLAFGLVEHGWEVDVLTSRQIYDDPDARLPERETLKGVRVHRLSTTRFGRHRLPGRLLDYLSFHTKVYRQLRRDQSDRLVVAMTDPPLIATTAALALKRSRSRLVIWNQDLFPEVAMVELLAGSRLAGKALERLRDIAFRRSACSVVLGEMMKERVEAAGMSPTRVIDNWALDESAHVAAGDRRTELGLEGAFVVGYSGNFGRVHDFDTIMNAALELRNNHHVRFLMTGAGPRYEAVGRFIDEHGLDNVVLGPYQPRERLGQMLATSDLHLISLANGYEGLVVPSKFYGIAASGRPALYVGSPDGDVARLIERWECGAVVPSGDGARLARAVTELSNNRERVRKMGQNGRRAWEQNWTRERAVERWHELLVRMSESSD